MGCSNGLLSWISLPYPVALGLGYAADLAAWVSRRKLPVSSIRVRKFCAETTVSARKLDGTGFVRPFSLEEGLRCTIAREREAVSAQGEAGSAKRFALGSLRCARCEIMRPHFRFEDLEIWQGAKGLAIKFHRVADGLDKRKLFRYAEQLRAAGLSLSNNIALRPVGA